jgi:MFS family permease
MSNTKFYGWKLVTVLFFIYFTASMAFIGGHITNTYMVNQIKMSSSLFNLGFSLVCLLLGLASPLAAGVSGKKGERYTISLGMMAILVGTLLMIFVGRTSLGYITVYGLIIGTGNAFATVLPIQAIITRWFQRKRALASGLVLSAGGFAGIASSAMVNYIIKTTGGNWKMAWICMAILTGLTTVVGILFIRNNPADMGQVPDGYADDQQTSAVKPTKTGKRVYQAKEAWVLQEAFKSLSLWLLLLAAASQFMAYYFCQGNSIFHLKDIGIPHAAAALSPGLLLAASIIGKLLSGALGDRIEPRFIIMSGLTLTAAGSLVLIHASSTLLIYMYAILVGIGFGLVYVCLFTMLGNYFGAGRIRSFLGFLIPIVTLFGAAGPQLGGIIKDLTGGYSPAIIGVAVIAALAAFSMFFALPPVKTKF